MMNRHKIVLTGLDFSLSEIERNKKNLNTDKGIEEYSDKVIKANGITPFFDGKDIVGFKKTVLCDTIAREQIYRDLTYYFKFSHINDGKYYYRMLNHKEVSELEKDTVPITDWIVRGKYGTLGQLSVEK